ncbi:MAG: hypothetical protein ABIJ75_10585 [Actinomycetota bacterium]
MEPVPLTVDVYLNGTVEDLAPYTTVTPDGMWMLTVMATRQLLDALVPGDAGGLSFDEWEAGLVLAGRMRDRFRGEETP